MRIGRFPPNVLMGPLSSTYAGGDSEMLRPGFAAPSRPAPVVKRLLGLLSPISTTPVQAVFSVHREFFSKMPGDGAATIVRGTVLVVARVPDEITDTGKVY
jgi:hypothetical protein